MTDNATPAQGTDIATTRTSHPLVQFKEQLEQRAGELKMALPDHISTAKFQRTIVTAVQQNPDLLGVSRQSLILACMRAAQDGLLPDGREAALVPFKRNFKDGGQWRSIEEAAYIPMVYGVRKKILQARDAEGKPVVSALEVGVVYRKEVEAGHFYYEVGKYPPLGHRPMLDLTTEDTTDDKIVGAYSIATMSDATKSYEFMRRFEIDKVQNASQTGAKVGRDGKPRTPKGPWADWYPEMCKKTVLRRHAKSLPQSGDLIIEADDDEPGTGESAALVLSAVDESSAQLITNNDGDTIDSTTGEVLSEGANATGNDTSAEPTAEAAEAEPEQKPTRANAKAKPEPEKARPAKAADPNPPADATAEEPAATDELGITEHPASKKADEVLEAFAKAETIIDLERIYGENELDVAAMPDEIYETVMGGYNRHRVRLGASRVPTKQAEPAE